jgi:hypothetical protein
MVILSRTDIDHLLQAENCLVHRPHEYSDIDCHRLALDSRARCQSVFGES